MIWKYDGKAVNINKGFRNSDGYMSPKNWYTAQDDKLKSRRASMGTNHQETNNLPPTNSS